MRQLLKEIHRRVVASVYKPWQVYFLASATFIGVGLVLDVRIVAGVLRSVEQILVELDWLVVLGIQGVLTGFAAEMLYEQGDGYAKAASHLFGSKDRTLIVRIGVMTVVAGIVTKIVPPALEQLTEYRVIQTAAAIVVLGILLVHEGSCEWKSRTEWPAIVAGAILAVTPSLV